MGDFGDYVHVKKTRKPFNCLLCGRTIPAGHSAYGFQGMWEGDWQNWKVCGMCEHAVMPLANPEEGVGDGDFDEYCDIHRVCPNGCKDKLGWPDCSRSWAEDKQSLVFTCRICGHVHSVPYPFEAPSEENAV